MTRADSPTDAARHRLLDWLGELGPRWGLPGDACRVHGCLYLAARPTSAAALSQFLKLDGGQTGEALAWLVEAGLAEEIEPGIWSTRSGPWEAMTIALEHRRALELPVALAALRESRLEAEADPVLARQIGKLLDLVEDVAAIDGQIRRLPPAMLRGLLGAGGRMARLFGGASGSRQ